MTIRYYGSEFASERGIATLRFGRQRREQLAIDKDFSTIPGRFEIGLHFSGHVSDCSSRFSSWNDRELRLTGSDTR